MNTTDPNQPESTPSTQVRVWRDRFDQPSLNQLLQSYPDDLATMARRLCRGIAGLDRVRKDIRWQGHSWCWTVTFRHPALAKDSPAEFAYLIPSPDALQLCIPLNDAMLDANVDGEEALAESDYIRETIDVAPHPHEWYWPVWSIATDEEADLLIALAGAKHRFLAES